MSNTLQKHPQGEYSQTQILATNSLKVRTSIAQTLTTHHEGKELSSSSTPPKHLEYEEHCTVDQILATNIITVRTL